MCQTHAAGPTGIWTLGAKAREVPGVALVQRPVTPNRTPARSMQQDLTTDTPEMEMRSKLAGASDYHRTGAHFLLLQSL